MRKVTILLLLILPSLLSASSIEDVHKGIHQRFGFGLYTGYTRSAGEIHPRESFDASIKDPDLLLSGFVLKYSFSFLFLRAATDYGFPLVGGSGNFKNGAAAEEYKITMINIPVSFGFLFNLTASSNLYIGMGPSFFIGDLKIKSDSLSSSYSFNDRGLHFIIGTEIALTETSYISFEWIHTSGVTRITGAGTKEREIGLQNNYIILGYNYFLHF